MKNLKSSELRRVRVTSATTAGLGLTWCLQNFCLTAQRGADLLLLLQLRDDLQSLFYFIWPIHTVSMPPANNTSHFKSLLGKIRCCFIFFVSSSAAVDEVIRKKCLSSPGNLTCNHKAAAVDGQLLTVGARAAAVGLRLSRCLTRWAVLRVAATQLSI